mmetsp:Transcript_1961/g.12381  ORF Transcript_1961/g.12381 Transcript_1961/m.12381 type:complete len:632 (-) Transcript_1961:1777-3672(-)
MSQQTTRPTPLSRPEGVPNTANRWILHPSAPVDVRVAFVMGGVGAAAYLWLKEEDKKDANGTQGSGAREQQDVNEREEKPMHIEPVRRKMHSREEGQQEVEMPNFEAQQDASGTEDRVESPNKDGIDPSDGHKEEDVPPSNKEDVQGESAGLPKVDGMQSEKDLHNEQEERKEDAPVQVEEHDPGAPPDNASPYATFEAEEDKEEERERKEHSTLSQENEENQEEAGRRSNSSVPNKADEEENREGPYPHVSVKEHAGDSRTNTLPSSDAEEPVTNEGQEEEESVEDPPGAEDQGSKEDGGGSGSSEQDSHPSRSTDELLKAALIHLSAEKKDRVVSAFRALKKDQQEAIHKAEMRARNAAGAHQRLRAEAIAALHRQKARAEATALEERRQRMASIDDLRLRVGALVTLLQQRNEDAHMAASASRISALAVSIKNVLEGEEDPAKIPIMLTAVEKDPLTGIVAEDLRKPPISLGALHAMWKDTKRKALMHDLMPRIDSSGVKPGQQPSQKGGRGPGGDPKAIPHGNNQGGLLANGLAQIGAALKILPREETTSSDRIEAHLARVDGAVRRGSCGEAAQFAATIAKQGGPKVAAAMAPFTEAAQQRARWEQAAGLLSAHSMVTSARHAKIQ